MIRANNFFQIFKLGVNGRNVFIKQDLIVPDQVLSHLFIVIFSFGIRVKHPVTAFYTKSTPKSLKVYIQFHKVLAISLDFGSRRFGVFLRISFLRSIIIFR